MAKIKPKEWARKSAEERARLEAEAEAPKAKPAAESKTSITKARELEIRIDAWTSTNWATKVNYGPACCCGHLSKEKCYRHDV